MNAYECIYYTDNKCEFSHNESNTGPIDVNKDKQIKILELELKAANDINDSINDEFEKYKDHSERCYNDLIK